MHKRNCILISLLILLIVGCGSSSTGCDEFRDLGNPACPKPFIPPIADANPGGIWTGTITSNVAGNTQEVIGVITESGEARFLTEQGSQIVGFLNSIGIVQLGTLTGIAEISSTWPDGSTVAYFLCS